MVSLFRSEEMAFCELILDSEVVYKSIAALGELGRIQFLDLNEESVSYKLKYAPDVRKCDEMERQILHIESAIKKKGIRINTDYGDVSVPKPKEFIKLQATLDEYETQLNEDDANISVLFNNRVELAQFQGVIDIFERYFQYLPSAEAQTSEGALGRQISILSSEVIPSESVASQLGYITGVIERQKAASFEQVLWRVGRGNIFVRSTDMIAEVEDSNERRPDFNVFMAFFPGATLRAKVEQICHAYHAKIYPCPLKAEQRLRVLEEIAVRRQDIEEILRQALDHRRLLMEKAARLCRTWKVQVRKVKAVYHTMNMFCIDITNKYLVGQCWIPTVFYDHVEITLRDAIGTTEAGQYVLNRLPNPRNLTIPTYFQTNKVSKAYQNIVHSFSIAKYKEVNPALFTTITFPFLFAVMFGDFGHGVIMACFGAWMCIKEKTLKKYAANSESFGMIFGGRYMILLMGLFSMYAGVLYNDCFAKAFNIFGSSWHTNYTVAEIHSRDKFEMDPGNSSQDKWPYPFGNDPAWDTSENRINFINSMKMKLSIIFGVSQMLFGIFLSVVNHVYFKQWINIICEFIPQLLFITCLFVYMDALIIFKWIYFGAHNVGSAPSILITMINMCLFKYSDETPYDAWVYNNLMQLQYTLFVIAILSVPWMLLVKPFYLRAKAKRRGRGGEHSNLLAAEELPANAYDVEAARFSQSHRLSGEVSIDLSSDFHGQTSALETIEETPGSLGGPRIATINVAFESPSDLAMMRPRGATITSVITVRTERSSVLENRTEQPEPEEEEFNFSEVFIHQSIHTIEYVLGLISHTASYLRLWALSLAHSELSTVLWTMVFRRGLSMASSGYVGWFAIFIIFMPWACLTVAILVMMEGMSAFLHALRLHWVEFQSKFYEGGGVLFQPFKFKAAYAKK